MTIKNATDNQVVESILATLADTEPMIAQLLNSQPPLKPEAHNLINDMMNYVRDAAKAISTLESSSEYLPRVRSILEAIQPHLSADTNRLSQMLDYLNHQGQVDVADGGLVERSEADWKDKLLGPNTLPPKPPQYILELVKGLIGFAGWVKEMIQHLPKDNAEKQLVPEKPTSLKQGSKEEIEIETPRTGHHMRVSDLLTAMATWLESPENEAILLAEDNEECLEAVATACLAAAEILKNAAAEAEVLEPAEPSKLTPAALDHLELVLAAFDTSGDEELQKTANVIDELLLTIAAPDWAKTFKEAKDNRLDTLERLYKDPKKELDALYKTKESAEKIDQSKIFEPHTFRSQQFALQSRSCPDHPGAGLARIGTDEWQCQMDKKVYNWRTGFTLETGEKVLGGEVQNQTPNYYPNPHSLFDSRETRLFGYTAGPKK